MGPSDLYVKMGSKVILTCVISQGPHDLGTILWYRGNNQAYVNVERDEIMSKTIYISPHRFLSALLNAFFLLFGPHSTLETAKYLWEKKDLCESIKLKLMTGHYRIHYEYLLKQNGLNSSRRGTLEALTHTLS